MKKIIKTIDDLRNFKIDNSYNIIIDVGSNKGDLSLNLLKNKANFLIAIEPIAELCNLLLKKATKLRFNQRLLILNFGIDIFNETKNLHISDLNNSGVSSFLKLNGKNLRNNNYWESRNDLKFDRTVKIQTYRLDLILKKINCKHINFIKIDCQGLDLNVLSSLGNYCKTTSMGMIECTASNDDLLYNETSSLITNTLIFLKSKKYEIFKIKPNDPACCEYNIFFKLKTVDHKNIEDKLSLRSSPIYSGKDYWYLSMPDYSDSFNKIISIFKKIINLYLKFTKHRYKQ